MHTRSLPPKSTLFRPPPLSTSLYWSVGRGHALQHELIHSVFLHLCHPTHFGANQAPHKPIARIKHTSCFHFGVSQFRTRKPTPLGVACVQSIVNTPRPTLPLFLTRVSSISLLCTHFALACAVPYVYSCILGVPSRSYITSSRPLSIFLQFLSSLLLH